MSKKDKMTKQRIAYCGRRLSNKGGLLDAFVLIDESTEDLFCYKAARRCRFIIGQVYDAKISADHTMDFGAFEPNDNERVSPVLIEDWSTADAVARRAQENEAARKKMQALCRHKWLERLEPLKYQYREMTAPQRRALRQLLIEWLEH